MSDKQKKFEPSSGWVNTINHQRVMVINLAAELNLDPVIVGQALDKTGHKLDVDTFNLTNDTWRLLRYEAQQGKPDLSVVSDEQKLDEEVDKDREEREADE